MVFATGAFQARVGDLELAEGARAESLRLILRFNWFPSDGFNLFLESGWDLLSVFGAHQDAGPIEGSLLHISLGTLCYAGSQNIDAVLRELGNVGRNSYQHTCGANMVVDLNESFR